MLATSEPMPYPDYLIKILDKTGVLLFQVESHFASTSVVAINHSSPKEYFLCIHSYCINIPFPQHACEHIIPENAKRFKFQQKYDISVSNLFEITLVLQFYSWKSDLLMLSFY